MSDSGETVLPYCVVDEDMDSTVSREVDEVEAIKNNNSLDYTSEMALMDVRKSFILSIALILLR